VRIHETRGPGSLVQGDAQAVHLLAKSRMGAHVLDHLAHAPKQPGIVEDRLAHRDTVPTKLARVPQQPGGMGEGPHGHRSVIRLHTAELVAGDEHGLGAQVCGAEGGEHTRRSSACYEDVEHGSRQPGRSASQRSARSLGMKAYSRPA
jgi:hypothetical protein